MTDSQPWMDAKPSMDQEHRIQTGLIEALCAAVEAGDDAGMAGTILAQLIAYSEAHFMSEELLMRLASYDDYEDHVADHIRMLDELQQISVRHQAGESGLVRGKAQAMLQFLRQHIETRDRRFADWDPH